MILGQSLLFWVGACIAVGLIGGCILGVYLLKRDDYAKRH